MLKSNVQAENIQIIRVAGALEIPLACKKIIIKEKPHAIIALGVIIRGETSHYDLVTEESYRGIMQVQLETGVAISFGILGCENLEQAQDRVSKNKLNKNTKSTESSCHFL